MSPGIRGKARGADGCALFLVYRDPSDDWKIKHAWAGIVGQGGIEAMTWYQLDASGRLVCQWLGRSRPVTAWGAVMDLPGYDAWKTMSPDDEDPRCEFCGASDREGSKGWQPNNCTGECGIKWLDPDAEYDAMRDGD